MDRGLVYAAYYTPYFTGRKSTASRYDKAKSYAGFVPV